MITVFTPSSSEPSHQAMWPGSELAQKIKSGIILAPTGAEIQLRLIFLKTGSRNFVAIFMQFHLKFHH
jgi:hypothetical protein